MPYSCPICSDLLDRLPQDPTNKHGANITCAPCGHLFHAFCINKWTSGDLPTNKQCPCCRKPIPNKRCLPLFPTIHDDSFLDETVSCNHEPELQDLKKKIKSIEKAKSDLEVRLSTLSYDLEEKKKDCAKERQRSERYQMQSVQLASIESYSKDLESQCASYKAQLDSLQKIQNIIDSVRSKTDVDVMGDYPVCKLSIDTLMDMNKILTHELKSAMSQNKTSQKQQEQLRQTQSKSNQEIKALSSQNRSLENKVASLEIELEELRQLNGLDTDQSIIKLPTPKATPARKRRGYEILLDGLTPDTVSSGGKREKQCFLDDSVIEITSEYENRDGHAPSKAKGKVPSNVFSNRLDTLGLGSSVGGKFDKARHFKTKSTSDLLCSSTSTSTSTSIAKPVTNVNPLRKGLKLKATASTSDLVAPISAFAASSSRPNPKPSSSSQPESKMRKMKISSDSDVIALPPMSYSANLKSNLYGLPITGTPVGTFSKFKPKDSSRRIQGIPRAPKILKK